MDSPTGDTDWDSLPVAGETGARRKSTRSSLGSGASPNNNSTGARSGRTSGAHGRESIGSPLGPNGRVDKGKGRASRSPSPGSPDPPEQQQQDYYEDNDVGFGGGGGESDDEEERELVRRQLQQNSDSEDEDEQRIPEGSPTSSIQNGDVPERVIKAKVSKKVAKRARSMTGEEGGKSPIVYPSPMMRSRHFVLSI